MAILSGDLDLDGKINFTRNPNPLTSRNLIPVQKDLNKETIDEIKKKYIEDTEQKKPVANAQEPKTAGKGKK